jgi:photosystem II stability/assembly factor-like uncharacterized protein
MRELSTRCRASRPFRRPRHERIGLPLIAIIALAAARCDTHRSTRTSSSVAATWSVAEHAGTLDLFSVDFVDPSHGWAVGDIDPRGTGGAVFHTTDGGRHWTPLAGRTEVSTSVHFIDRKTGWIAGYAGRIDRTDDGGLSWRPQRSERGREVFNSIWAVDSRCAWAVGANGFGVRTTDGGATWTSMSLGGSADFWSVRFGSTERGWAVGDAGAIRSTTDGGATWTAVQSGTTRALYGLALATEEIVVAVGEGGTILRSDGGTAWMPIKSPVSAALYGVAGRGLTLWAVGARGTTIGSEDGGTSWKGLAPLADEKLTAVALIDARHGAAVGRRGYVQVLQ